MNRDNLIKKTEKNHDVQLNIKKLNWRKKSVKKIKLKKKLESIGLTTQTYDLNYKARTT
jgi:hypothetical protein